MIVTLTTNQGARLFSAECNTFAGAIDVVMHALNAQQHFNWERSAEKGTRLIVSIGAPQEEPTKPPDGFTPREWEDRARAARLAPGPMLMLQMKGDRVAVVPNPMANRKVLPDQEHSGTGVVIAVGPGRRLENGMIAPMDVAVGDLVLYSRFSGVEATVEGQALLILEEAQILATIKAVGAESTKED